MQHSIKIVGECFVQRKPSLVRLNNVSCKAWAENKSCLGVRVEEKASKDRKGERWEGKKKREREKLEKKIEEECTKPVWREKCEEERSM